MEYLPRHETNEFCSCQHPPASSWRGTRDTGIHDQQGAEVFVFLSRPFLSVSFF